MVSTKTLRRNGDYEDIEESDDGDDGQRRVANKRRSHGTCQRIGLVHDGLFFEEIPAVLLFLGKLCEDPGKIYHWTSDQNPHLTTKA